MIPPEQIIYSYSTQCVRHLQASSNLPPAQTASKPPILQPHPSGTDACKYCHPVSTASQTLLRWGSGFQPSPVALAVQSKSWGVGEWAHRALPSVEPFKPAEQRQRGAPLWARTLWPALSHLREASQAQTSPKPCAESGLWWQKAEQVC